MSCQEKMLTEITKFLSVYSKLSGGDSIEIDMKDYADFIRTLGHYLYTTNLDSWVSSTISFGDVKIDMSVFDNTNYKPKVHQFLVCLKKAFHSNLDDDINNYILTTTDFNDEEKKVCIESHGYMSRLQNAMKQGIFKDAIEHKVASNETISSYSEQLKEFNEYTKSVSSDPIKYDIIQRFHKVLPAIAAQKTQPDIFFDA
jgi:hypothetical protein